MFARKRLYSRPGFLIDERAVRQSARDRSRRHPGNPREIADISDLAFFTHTTVFRQLPGIRSESSSGGGNSNINVRGIPISTGGAKFLSMQEDGLPIVLFGDLLFAPADGFYKADTTLARVESVRGGTASTLTTNGPGGIIRSGLTVFPGRVCCRLRDTCRC